jgi:ethanolamine utilization protein EutN
MELAIVVGQVVSTVKHPGLEHDRLLAVELIDSDGQPKGGGSLYVAVDPIGAGNGEWVLVVRGSSARQAKTTPSTPVDMSIVGVVDEVVIKGQVAYHK